MTDATVRSSRLWLVGVVVLCLAAVAVALVSQHVYDKQPCPWCVLQRLIFVVIALVALIGLALPRIGGGLVLLLALSGMAAALWQHFVAASSSSCNLTLADRIVTSTQLDVLLPDVFQARAGCADAAVILFGLPYEFWSLALFALAGAVGVRVLLAR
jgi:protein dithiol:quinone oxidoreductase